MQEVFDLDNNTPLPTLSKHHQIPNSLTPTCITLNAESQEGMLSSSLAQHSTKLCAEGKYLTILDSSHIHDPLTIHDTQPGPLATLSESTPPIYHP